MKSIMDTRADLLRINWHLLHVKRLQKSSKATDGHQPAINAVVFRKATAKHQLVGKFSTGKTDNRRIAGDNKQQTDRVNINIIDRRTLSDTRSSTMLRYSYSLLQVDIQRQITLLLLLFIFRIWSLWRNMSKKTKTSIFVSFDIWQSCYWSTY